MKNNLVLSIFPGIDLFGRAFEEYGYTVVRGPDLLWASDIKTFHPPAGVFEGVIGGPPCKGESKLAHLNGNAGVSLASEFIRVVKESAPDWWVMEAVIEHPAPYILKLSPRWIGEKQSRVRYFHSNLNLQPLIDVSLFENPIYKYAVLANHGGKQGTVHYRQATYKWAEMLELQGLTPTFELPFFTRQKSREVVGNGVPMCVGRAIASAVRRATNG